jgi:hypothetical protein
MVDIPLASGCVPGPDAVLLPGPEAEDKREDPTLFTSPATGPPPPLLPPAQSQNKPGKQTNRWQQCKDKLIWLYCIVFVLYLYCIYIVLY